MSDKVPGVLKKILAIQKALEVEKTGYDDNNDYRYYTAEDVATSLRRLMNENSLIHRTVIHETREENVWDKNGRNRPRISVTGEVVFIDAEDGSEFPSAVVATGSDTGGDKATRKLHVQMFKIAAVDVFKITSEFQAFDSDGDKPSEPINMDEEPPQEAKKTLAELNARIAEIVNDEANAVDGKQVSTIGNKIAKKEGFAEKSSVWRKESGVMTALVDELEAIVKKTAETGEV